MVVVVVAVVQRLSLISRLYRLRTTQGIVGFVYC